MSIYSCHVNFERYHYIHFDTNIFILTFKFQNSEISNSLCVSCNHTYQNQCNPFSLWILVDIILFCIGCPYTNLIGVDGLESYTNQILLLGKF